MPVTDTYLSNPNLKRAGVQLQFTKEQVSEYIKCSKDILYFATHYYKIIHVDKGLINFKPYTYQQKILLECVHNRFVICKLPRQSGKTTAIACLFLWYALFNDNFSTAILANKLDTAQEILERIQLAYENLPMWLQQGVVEWNKRSILLENNSKIVARATSPSAIRGGSLNIVYLDEFAFVENNMQEKFYTSAFPTITSGTTTKMIITSTPQGLNLFYKLWTDSEQGRNDFTRIEIHWSETPGRDAKWAQQTLAALGSMRQFEQEYGTEFLGSSLTLISGAVLRRLTWKETPLNNIVESPHLGIYHYPQIGHTYAATVDTSRGVNEDYSCVVVFDISDTPYNVVAVYRNNEIPTTVFPQIVYELCQKYNNAFVLPERNDLGEEVINILHDEYEYENILSTQSKGRRGKILSSGFSTSTQLGLTTNKVTKAVGCSYLKAMIEGDQLIFNDYNIFYELSRFVQVGKSYEAEEGCHDDLAMCLVLFSWMIKQPFMKEITNVNFRQRYMQQKAQNFEQDLVPIGIFTTKPFEDLPNGIIDIDAHPERHLTFEQALYGDDDDPASSW